MDQPPPTPSDETPPSGPEPTAPEPVAVPAAAPTPAAASPAGPAPSGWVAPAAAAPVVGWTMPVAEPTTRRGATGLAKVAGAMLILLGLIVVVAGVLLAVGAVAVRDLGTTAGGSQVGDAFGGVVAVFAIIILFIGLVEMLAGMGAIRGSGWGRIIGLIYGVLGSLFGLLALSGARSGATATNDTAVTGTAAGTGVVILVLYLFITIILAFRFRPRSA
jgi:hypothetical protein